MNYLKFFSETILREEQILQKIDKNCLAIKQNASTILNSSEYIQRQLSIVKNSEVIYPSYLDLLPLKELSEFSVEAQQSEKNYTIQNFFSNFNPEVE